MRVKGCLYEKGQRSEMARTRLVQDQSQISRRTAITAIGMAITTESARTGRESLKKEKKRRKETKKKEKE